MLNKILVLLLLASEPVFAGPPMFGNEPPSDTLVLYLVLMIGVLALILFDHSLWTTFSNRKVKPIPLGENEGEACGDAGCDGRLYYAPVKNCTCFIAPPCSKCVNNPLTCPECGREVYREESF
jgi:hypothetical protein